MRAQTRPGISTQVMVGALVVVIVVAGVAVYAVTAPSHQSTTSSSRISSTSTTPVGLNLTMVPPSPLVSPGETQNYSLLQVSTSGSPSGNASLTAVAPSGISVVLNQTSVPLSQVPQPIPVIIKASPGVAAGNYSLTIEARWGTQAANQTFKIDVVQMLVIMQDVAFHPQNATVARGTVVTWLNLDSTIGCCDPGYHDVSFLTGANATSPILKRYETWSYTFGTDGVYNYYCTIHPYMKATIVVTG